MLLAKLAHAKERTNLKDLRIGDYIKWSYTDYTVDKPGKLSPYDPSSGLQELPEYAESKPSHGNGGYFYFIKIDKGLCIADRCIWTSTGHDGWYFCMLLNSMNLYKSSTYRLLSLAESTKYLNTDLNGIAIVPIGKTLQAIDFTYYNRNCDYILLLDFASYFSQGGRVDDAWNYASTESSAIYHFLPAMEYADNDNSTNIFY